MPARFAPIIDDKPMRTLCEVTLECNTTDAPSVKLEEMHAMFTQLLKQYVDSLNTQMALEFPLQDKFEIKVTKYDDYRSHDSYLP